MERSGWSNGVSLRALTFVGVVMLAGGSMGSSCLSNIGASTVKDATAQLTQVLNNGITTLSNNSQIWNDTLTGMIGQLTDQAQATVRNELTNLLNGSIALASTEVRCDIDFIGKRVVQALQKIKAAVLGQPPPPGDPHVCSAVPAGIDFKLWQTSPQSIPSVSFFGFDLDDPSLKLSLIDTAGNKDVTSSMVRTSSYQLTINLGSNGVKLATTSNKLQLIANGNAANPVGELAVIQPKVPLCKTMAMDVKNLTGLPKFIPAWTGPGPQHSDQDFDGHGPHLTASFDLIIHGVELNATLYIDAKETRPDYTEASGLKGYQLWKADPGWAIASVISPTHSGIDYIDTTVGDPGSATDDTFAGGNGPVASWVCTGDTSHGEAGLTTGCTVAAFNVIRVNLIQTTNCVTSAAVKSLLRDENKLSPETAQQLKTLQPAQ